MAVGYPIAHQGYYSVPGYVLHTATLDRRERLLQGEYPMSEVNPAGVLSKEDWNLILGCLDARRSGYFQDGPYYALYTDLIDKVTRVMEAFDD